MQEKTRDPDKMLELAIVIMLGVTAICTAWASWIGSLHAGNQAVNYATSNLLSSDAHSEYNSALQHMGQDLQLWNDISDIRVEILFARRAEDSLTVDKASARLFFRLNQDLSPELAEYIGWDHAGEEYDPSTATALALEWMEDSRSNRSPFLDAGYVNRYFEMSYELMERSSAALKQGQEDSANGDAFGLVSVIYSVVLFLLGIAGTFDHRSNARAVFVISLVAFAAATAYMLTLPMPAGFDITSFFKNG